MNSVLHVGNIAHNAYFNELILRKKGRSGCVVHHDAYHFASCPQWLKLSNRGINRISLGDDNFPNFFQFEKSEELVPDFFYQGPSYQVFGCLYSLCTNKFDINNELYKSSRSLMDFARYKCIYKKNHTECFEVWDDEIFAQSLIDLNVHKSWIKVLNEGFRLDKYRYQFVAHLNILCGLKLKLVHLPQSQTYINYMINFFKNNLKIKTSNNFDSSHESLRFLKESMLNIDFLKALGIVQISENIYDPTKREDLKELDTLPYHKTIPYWDCIRSFFDFNIFYGSHAIIPSLSINGKTYAAYEHGTIRSIPFQNNDIGRLTKYAYENAKVVMITNADYIYAKKRLEFNTQNIVYIPHGFDDESCTNFLNVFKKAKQKNDIIKFFAPARHDWVNGDDGHSKGNEIIVKAAKKLVEGEQTNFLVTMLEYGSDIQVTKNLIQQLKLNAHFEWKHTMTREEMWSFYLNSNAVLDQFYIPAIGQIGVETIALGVRLVNADNGSMDKFFGEKSPILAANTPEELAKQMLNIMADPDDMSGVGDYGRAWFARHHSMDAIGSKLDRAIEILKS